MTTPWMKRYADTLPEMAAKKKHARRVKPWTPEKRKAQREKQKKLLRKNREQLAREREEARIKRIANAQRLYNEAVMKTKTKGVQNA